MAGAYALPVVEGVTIGRTVSLDPRAWQRYGEETYFALDRYELPITAQGLIRLDDGTSVHRFYTDEEIMDLAICCVCWLGAGRLNAVLDVGTSCPVKVVEGGVIMGQREPAGVR